MAVERSVSVPPGPASAPTEPPLCSLEELSRTVEEQQVLLARVSQEILGGVFQTELTRLSTLCADLQKQHQLHAEALKEGLLAMQSSHSNFDNLRAELRREIQREREELRQACETQSTSLKDSVSEWHRSELEQLRGELFAEQASSAAKLGARGAAQGEKIDTRDVLSRLDELVSTQWRQQREEVQELCADMAEELREEFRQQGQDLRTLSEKMSKQDVALAELIRSQLGMSALAGRRPPDTIKWNSIIDGRQGAQALETRSRESSEKAPGAEESDTGSAAASEPEPETRRFSTVEDGKESALPRKSEDPSPALASTVPESPGASCSSYEAEGGDPASPSLTPEKSPRHALCVPSSGGQVPTPAELDAELPPTSPRETLPSQDGSTPCSPSGSARRVSPCGAFVASLCSR